MQGARADRRTHALFGFLHYFDPHDPYAPPEGLRTRFHPGRARPRPEETSQFLDLNRSRRIDPATVDGRRYKLVKHRDQPAVLQDLSADPGGHGEVSLAHPDVRERLLARAAAMGLAAQVERPREPVTRSMRERLRAIGYLDEVDPIHEEATPSPDRVAP